MTNLRTDEMVLYRNLTKIDTDENKAIYSKWNFSKLFWSQITNNKQIIISILSSHITYACLKYSFTLKLSPVTLTLSINKLTLIH